MENIITFISDYVTALIEVQNKFIENLQDFSGFEQKVVELTNHIAARFMGAALTEADTLIRESGLRKKHYTVQRKRHRTLISCVGDITFEHTLYKDQEGHIRCLLDEQLRLPDRERFTAMAEARLLSEAEVHSYQHAADSIKVGDQAISRTTVMNKIHAIVENIPCLEPVTDERKQLPYLYIEADEDHIHRQKDDENDGCFIGKLVYLFEGKEDICEGRRQLINPHFFGGIYNGKSNAELWKQVEEYIRDHYDQETLKCVYISGDGGKWIRSGTNHVYKSKFVADRFHLMKYIYRVSRYTLHDRDETVGQFYKYIYKNRLREALELLAQIRDNYEESEGAVDECRTFMEKNWTAIHRAFCDKNVIGCSAEGHVSCIYSERLSSRPMGWSATGGDRMCKLRCFVRNYGRDKIIDLVQYRRDQQVQKLAATGTDGLIDQATKKKYKAEQRQNRAYIERIQATLGVSSTVRKALAIREQIGNI